jgi:hypothetical protein
LTQTAPKGVADLDGNGHSAFGPGCLDTSLLVLIVVD